MEEKDKTEFDLGFDRGYKEGFRAGRRDEFISPLMRLIFIGLLLAVAIVSGLLAFGFMISILAVDVVTGIIGTVICGLIAGASGGATCYLMTEIKL